MRRDWLTSIPLLVLLVVLFSGFTPTSRRSGASPACILIGLSNRNPVVAVAVLAAVVAAELAGQLSEWLGRRRHSQRRAARCRGGTLPRTHWPAERLLDVLDAFVTWELSTPSVSARPAARRVGIIVGVVDPDRGSVSSFRAS